jgi:hypothetical protein
MKKSIIFALLRFQKINFSGLKVEKKCKIQINNVMEQPIKNTRRSGSNIPAAVHRSLTLNGKGGYIMKKPVLQSSSLLLLLLGLGLTVIFMAASCEKPENACTCEKPGNVDPKQEEGISAWKSILAPDVTLTLTIDELQHKMYVSTSPPFADFHITGWDEMLHHGQASSYRLAGDPMFLISLLTQDSTSNAWIKTMLSPDSMQLDYWGPVNDYQRTRYLFSRMYAL